MPMIPISLLIYTELEGLRDVGVGINNSFENEDD
jgi:hypothetical protein